MILAAALRLPDTRATRLIVTLAICIGSVCAADTATVPLSALPANTRLALCGDSITEQMRYTAYVEAYLLACAGRTDISVFQFGWGGENADQFRNRVTRGDLDAFKPTAVTIAYGANDGGGQAWQPWMQTMWSGRMKAALATVAERYPATIAATVIVSPTWFQVHSDGSNAKTIDGANDTLAHFRGIDLALATERRVGFADVRSRMVTSATAAMAKLGAGYRFGGNDGVHPGPAGHLLIAHEVLKSLGVTGTIATITVGKNGKASASAGHQVTNTTGGRLTITSARYPFCPAYERSSAADRLESILPFLPFTQELNRFTLVVEHLDAPQATVTWGDETHTFSAGELAAGVNLMATFSRTPFDEAFAQVMARIATKQVKERDMIKAAGDPTAAKSAWTVADVTDRDALDAAVHAAIVPVTHTIILAPVR